MNNVQIIKLETVYIALSKIKNINIWIYTLNPLTLKDIQHIEVLTQRHPTVSVIIGLMGGRNLIAI